MTHPQRDARIAQAAAGDADAFASLVAEHGPDVHRICMVITTDRVLAEEAAAKAWQQAWIKLHTVRHRERLRAWLLRVAANEAKQIMRQDRRRLEVRLESVRDFGGSEVDPQRHAALRDALRMLAPRDRELLAHRYLFGLRSDEIGRQVGLSGEGVRTRLKRIRDRLHQELSDHG